MCPLGIGQEQLDQLILDIHAAPLDEGKWQSVVRSIAAAVCADKALLFAVPTRPDVPFWHVPFELSEETLAEYAAEYAQEDVWIAETVRSGRTKVGMVHTGEQLIARRDYQRSRFYGEFLKRIDVDRFVNVALRDPLGAGQPASAVLSLYRAHNRDPFEEPELALIQKLKPHLLLAARTFWSLQSVATQAQGALWTINALSTPLIILDTSHRVLHANPEAEKYCRSHGVFRCEAGRLVPVAGHYGSGQLSRNLARLKDGCASVTEMSLSGRTILVSMAPIRESASALHFWPRAAGLVWMATGVVNTSALDHVGGVFGLTPSELRLLRLLVSGRGVVEAAAEAGISVHTARTQLKSMQRKTGWHSQAEMVRMLGQLGALAP